ncbi:hypothetical protein P879_08530 [Paragonimus westermani]|uniref:SCP domain-containing protein n=1 Tax=Paragonimus westermani TaxID=34504 RepID=A0A8T0DJH7_9TREM|nr:hypothetical protein P879_08530 [Paragonimus westermani]
MTQRELNHDAIAAHNYFRAAHGCPKLRHDKNLERSAQKWAKELAKANRLYHSEAKNYGENLAFRWCSGKGNLSGHEASQMWYDEVACHNFNGQFASKSGHFSQLIWKSTSKCGFGRAISSDGKSAYVVGHYYPPGNVQGQFAENVPRAKRPVKQYAPKPKKQSNACVIL